MLLQMNSLFLLDLYELSRGTSLVVAVIQSCLLSSIMTLCKFLQDAAELNLFLLSRYRWTNSSSRVWYTQVGIGLAAYSLRVHNIMWNFHRLFSSERTQKLASVLLHVSSYWKIDQASPPLLTRWTFLLRNWKECISLVQFQILIRNVDKSATSL